MAKAPLNSYVQETLDRIVQKFIESLEGDKIPWHRSWKGSSLIPHNFTTGRSYSGLNQLVLWMTEEARGFNDTRWGGKKQIIKAGYRIDQDQWKKGTAIFAPILRPYFYTDDDGSRRKGMALKGWRVVQVWNAAQCEGVPAPVELEKIDPSVGFERAAALVEAAGMDITHKGNRAFYSPADDSITLPPAGAFDSAAAYWSVNMHEHIHATGHKSRLDREGVGGFSSRTVYAFEELVAEMGSAFLCNVLGINAPELQPNHEAYIQSWIKVLNEDPTQLMKAAGQAQKAMDYILKLEKAA